MRSTLAKVGVLLMLLSLLLAAILGFPGLLNAYLVRPVALSLWAIWRIIISVDQAVYWFLLVVLCALGMVAFFAVRDAAPLASPSRQAKRHSRVEHWRSLFRQAQRTAEGDAALKASLRNLLAATVRHADLPSGSNVGQALKARHVSLPPRVREYLGIGIEGDAQQARPASLLSRLRRLIGRPEAARDAIIEEALQWMESATEINDDRSRYS